MSRIILLIAIVLCSCGQQTANRPMGLLATVTPGTKYVLKPLGTQIYYTNISSSFPNLKGGDTLAIPAGNYTLIQLTNFKGDSLNPVVVINQGGQVSVTSQIRLYSASFFKFTGTGDPNVKYGFYGHDHNTAGLLVTNQSTDYIVEYCQFKNVVNGVFSKVQVDVNNPLTYTPGWEFRNAEYRFIDVQNSSGEAFYIGHTLTPSPCDNGNLLPVKYKNLKIHDCTITGAGWDGIQVSLAGDSCLIYNNTINDYGWENKSSQKSGIVFGGYSTGRVFNNTINRGTGSGISVFGYGNIKVYNNNLDSCGIWKGTPKDAADQAYVPDPSIYCNGNVSSCLPNYPVPPLQVTITNNCIQNISTYASGAAIRNNGNNSIAGTISNNSIGDPQNRALTNTIVSNPKDAITGNVLGACQTIPPVVIPPVIVPPVITPIVYQTEQKQIGDTLIIKIYKK